MAFYQLISKYGIVTMN